MLKAVQDVRDLLLVKCEGREIDLESITDAFKTLTVIDYIVFVQYDAGAENPIWGEFKRWNRSPSVYSPEQTLVEIRYAAHLTEPWRKFVVTKELCHSLVAPVGTHNITSAGVDALIQAFSLTSSLNHPGGNSPKAFEFEVLAEAGAIEVLCPITRRREILATNAHPDLSEVAQELNIPLQYVTQAFNPAYIEAIASLLNNKE